MRWLVWCVALSGCASRPVTRPLLATQMTGSLRHELLDAWYPRAIDADSGGFLSQFDYRWHPTGTQDKMIVTQARHVWTTARAAQFFPTDTMFRRAAAHGFSFLRDKMWDSADGGFFWLVSRGGVVRAEPDGRIIKRAYGNAFGIYGLAEYYAESHDTAALDLARRAFRWLDRHAHDPIHAGYFQYMERDGTPLPDGYQHDPPKDQNSSIHIMEAFTELYRVWPDSVLRARLNEMLVLIRDRIRTDPGYLHLFFTADWTPIVNGPSPLDHVSYGHDVETAYLMLEASQALGLRDDTLTLRFAKQMVDHALATGWDAAVGGFYDEGYETRVTRPTKNWWAQAEGLNSLLLMADLFPADPHRYYACFLKQWSYIDTYLIDHTYGGWYEGGLDQEPERRHGLKGHIWKAAYHDSRALMNVILRVRTRDSG